MASAQQQTALIQRFGNNVVNLFAQLLEVRRMHVFFVLLV